MYYRLKPEIYLINGKYYSNLCNVLTGDIIALDIKTAELINKAEANEPVEINANIQELIEMDWMIEVDIPVYIEKVRFTNIFNKKRAWKNFPPISLVVLKLTNKCERACKDILCKQSFCPMCTINENRKELKVEEWKEIIDKISFFKPQNYIITGGSPTLYKGLNKISRYIKEKGSDVSIHVNSVNELKRLGEYDNIYLTVFNKKDELLAYTGNKNKNLSIFSNQIATSDKHYSININQPNITKNSFRAKSSFGLLFTRMMYDSCLYGKLTILNDGSIVPCLGMDKELVGNLKNTDFLTTLKELYEKYWAVSISELETGKCKDCAYRYNCTSCKKFEDDFCDYNMEAGVWK